MWERAVLKLCISYLQLLSFLLLSFLFLPSFSPSLFLFLLYVRDIKTRLPYLLATYYLFKIISEIIWVNMSVIISSLQKYSEVGEEFMALLFCNCDLISDVWPLTRTCVFSFLVYVSSIIIYSFS